MPRTQITPQQARSAGLVPTYEAANASGGNSYALAQARELRVKNGSGASVTVTLQVPVTVDGLAVTPRTIAVAAGTETTVGLGRGDTYRQADGQAYVDYSATTSVTVCVVDVP